MMSILAQGNPLHMLTDSPHFRDNRTHIQINVELMKHKYLSIIAETLVNCYTLPCEVIYQLGCISSSNKICVYVFHFLSNFDKSLYVVMLIKGIKEYIKQFL